MKKNSLTSWLTHIDRHCRILSAGLLSLLVSYGTIAQPQPRMGISPDRYEISFDARGAETQSLMVQNLGEEPITVKLSVSHWDLDENNQIRVIEPTESSLDQWIVINPLIVTIPPKTPQTIRWAVMPRLKPADGEYRAMIFIEEDLPSGDAGRGSQVRMKMRYGLPVYGQVGEPSLGAELHRVDVDRDNNRVFLEITNTGNAHGRLSGGFGVWPIDTFPGTEEALEQIKRTLNSKRQPEDFLLGNMPGTVILPGNRRSIPVDIVVGQPGDYMVQLYAEFFGLEITDTLQITEPDS